MFFFTKITEIKIGKKSKDIMIRPLKTEFENIAPLFNKKSKPQRHGMHPVSSEIKVSEITPKNLKKKKK